MAHSKRILTEIHILKGMHDEGGLNDTEFDAFKHLLLTELNGSFFNIPNHEIEIILQDFKTLVNDTILSETDLANTRSSILSNVQTDNRVNGITFAYDLKKRDLITNSEFTVIKARLAGLPLPTRNPQDIVSAQDFKDTITSLLAESEVHVTRYQRELGLFRIKEIAYTEITPDGYLELLAYRQELRTWFDNYNNTGEVYTPIANPLYPIFPGIYG